MKSDKLLKSKFKVSVSVLMSVYNTKEEYLRKAVESILNQSFTDYEFIIFNDGGDKKITTIIQGYSDKRIRLVENSENIGLTKNLNKGITMARGKYIARMDADDISLPNRLKVQHYYMEKHPDIDILGGAVWSNNVKNVYWRYFSQEWRKVNLLFGNYGICHPTAFFKTEFLRNNKLFYNEKFSKAQDYELWTRALRIGKLVVHKEPVLYYRCHEGQISKNIGSSAQQKALDTQVRRNLFTELIPEATGEEYEQLLNMNVEVLSADSLSKLFIYIIKENEKKNIYSMYYLKNELALRWFWILRGEIPRTNLKEYRRGYWFRYLMMPQFIKYFLKNRILRFLCEPRKIRRKEKVEFS